jgi:hypothetical protein
VIGTRGLVIAIVASLIVGVSTGMVAGVLILRFTPVLRPMPPGPPGFPGRPMFGPGSPADPMAADGQRMLLLRLSDDLDLDAGQRARVMAVLESARVARDAARESVRVRIERELTPQQREEWRRIESRFRRSWRERAGRLGPWGGWR